jgi:hypothetical protein
MTAHFGRCDCGDEVTHGEVCFCPVPLSQFPELERLRRSFLRKYPLIYDNHPMGEHRFDYLRVQPGIGGQYAPSQVVQPR